MKSISTYVASLALLAGCATAPIEENRNPITLGRPVLEETIAAAYIHNGSFGKMQPTLSTDNHYFGRITATTTREGHYIFQTDPTFRPIENRVREIFESLYTGAEIPDFKETIGTASRLMQSSQSENGTHKSSVDLKEGRLYDLGYRNATVTFKGNQDMDYIGQEIEVLLPGYDNLPSVRAKWDLGSSKSGISFSTLGYNFNAQLTDGKSTGDIPMHTVIKEATKHLKPSSK